MAFVRALVVLLALVFAGCGKGANSAGDASGVTIEYVPIAISWVKKFVTASSTEVAAWAKTPAGIAALRTEIRHVLVRVAPGASAKQVAAAKRRAREISARVEGGEDIQAVAADVSDDDDTRDNGGSLGSDDAKLDEALRAAASKLGPGEMTSEPVRTRAGFHVLMRDRPVKGELEKAYKKARAAEVARKLADEMLSRMQASSEPLDDIAVAAITALLEAGAADDSARRKAVAISPRRAADADLPPDAQEALASFARKAKPGDVVDSALGTGPVLVVARAVARKE
ncbi:MAG: peptidylprolyl isomerase [Labilithrix sp.]|nr:peptidylprolyl isomerase [Labilithrix sp.]